MSPATLNQIPRCMTDSAWHECSFVCTTRGMILIDRCHTWQAATCYHAWHQFFNCIHVPRVGYHPTRGTWQDLMPHVASNLKFMCHAWAKIPRVARDTLLPGSLTTRGLTPPAPPPARRMCHTLHARRTLRPLYLAHVPRVASHRRRRPLAVHVPRVASHRTRRPLP